MRVSDVERLSVSMDIPSRYPEQNWKRREVCAKPLRPFCVAPVLCLFPEILEVLCLFTKDGGNGLYGVIILEALGERVFGQIYAHLLLVVLQSGLKEYTQTCRSLLVTHVKSRGGRSIGLGGGRKQ